MTIWIGMLIFALGMIAGIMITNGKQYSNRKQECVSRCVSCVFCDSIDMDSDWPLMCSKGHLCYKYSGNKIPSFCNMYKPRFKDQIDTGDAG